MHAKGGKLSTLLPCFFSLNILEKTLIIKSQQCLSFYFYNSSQLNGYQSLSNFLWVCIYLFLLFYYNKSCKNSNLVYFQTENEITGLSRNLSMYFVKCFIVARFLVGLHHFILPSAMHECLDKNKCQAFEYLTIHSWENGLIYFIVWNYLSNLLFNWTTMNT